jgi:hypothetical protein
MSGGGERVRVTYTGSSIGMTVFGITTTLPNSTLSLNTPLCVIVIGSGANVVVYTNGTVRESCSGVNDF